MPHSGHSHAHSYRTGWRDTNVCSRRNTDVEERDIDDHASS